MSGNSIADTIVEMQVPAELAPGKPNNDELLAYDVVMSLEDSVLQRCKGFVVESVCKGLKGPRYEYSLTMKSSVEERILTGAAGQKRYEQLEVQVQLLNRTPLGGKCITVTSKLEMCINMRIRNDCYGVERKFVSYATLDLCPPLKLKHRQCTLFRLRCR